MYEVSREINFCYGHRLIGYPGACRRLHGHNGRLLVTVRAPKLDQLGMVVDFKTLKKTVEDWVDRLLDHRMILRNDDPAVPVLAELGEPITVLDVIPTAENLARLVAQVATEAGFDVAEVALWESPKSFAVYRPTEETAEPPIEVKQIGPVDC